VRDRRAWDGLLRETKPDLIYHLAAQPYPGVSWRDPVHTMDVNVTGTIHLFESLRTLSLRPRVLIACSGAEYGVVPENEQPIKEHRELLPLHPYGISKVAQDLLAFEYHAAYGLHTIRARLFNTTGPGKSGDACGDFTMRQAQIDRGFRDPVLTVGNLSARRDITDVRDTVLALDLLLQKGRAGDVYNVCSGTAVSLQHVAETVVRLGQKRSRIEVDKNLLRPADESLLVGDNSKLCNATGWKPTVPLDKTLSDMLDYWRQRVSAAMAVEKA
ncbi:MAG TPA: GDP-mannose 4,6-dehydratase, partial [Burkholderiales bacterium]|nr:GDP-mannose 4,6-dehydratase [Burkholderiales bacterium]